MKSLIFVLFAPLAAQAAIVEPWPLPAGTPSSQPSVAAQGDAVHAAWIEPDGDGHRLLLAKNGQAPATTIARGTGWFVNWADFPGLAVMADGSFAAHVLVKRSQAPYAYDVQLLRSADGGIWSAPVTVHDDGTATEHGFVSLWPQGADGVGVAWLDGRATGGGDHAHHGHGGGAMTVRAAHFNAAGKRDDVVIDDATCDCCQTDAALAAKGPVLVYRGRSRQEVRDIMIVRQRDGVWTQPRAVHADGWVMPACPVNGPAVTAHGDEIVVAWYTGAGGQPQVRLARSRDDGASFAAPITIALGPQVQGRVDVQGDSEHVVLTWIDEDDIKQTLRLARFTADLSKELERVDVATLARGRATGFPRLALAQGQAYVVWTDIVERAPQVRGARIRFDD